MASERLEHEDALIQLMMKEVGLGLKEVGLKGSDSISESGISESGISGSISDLLVFTLHRCGREQLARRMNEDSHQLNLTSVMPPSASLPDAWYSPMELYGLPEERMGAVETEKMAVSSEK